VFSLSMDGRVKPGDDECRREGRNLRRRYAMAACNGRFGKTIPTVSLPGLTGQSINPSAVGEMPCLTHVQGLLDRPVKPGDDSRCEVEASVTDF
jgi:hypothetical protein